MDPMLRPAGPSSTIAAAALCDFASVVAHAQALQRAAEAGATHHWLRGRKFGMLHGSDAACGGDSAALFERAVAELGGRVAHLRPGLTEGSPAREVKQMAEVLGRLYDAVACEGLSAGLVERLRADAKIPVYDDLIAPGRLFARAVDDLGGTASMPDPWRFVLQALLLKATA